MRITRIGAKNFRAIGLVDLELMPLTVLIGPNGVGKSSILEMLQVLSGLQKEGRLLESVARWGGYNATVFYGAREPRMSFAVSVSDASDRLDYHLELLGERGSFFVSAERLEKRRSDGHDNLLVRNDSRVYMFRGEPGLPIASYSPTEEHINHGPESCLSGQRLVLPQIEILLAALRRTSLWQVHKFQPTDRVRAPQQLHPAKEPLPDGSNLFSVLYTMKTERRDSYLELLETLRLAVPELEELEFPLAGAGHVSLTWKQSDFTQVFYSNQLSDGILRFLWLATILFSVPDDGLVMIDEPELSLHPDWLALLVALLRKTSARTNVLVATQSAELLRWIEPSELVIPDVTETGTTFTPAAKKLDMNRWLKDFTLSELWTMGELGGRR